MLGDPSSWSHSRPHHLALLRTGPILGSSTATLTARGPDCPRRCSPGRCRWGGRRGGGCFGVLLTRATAAGEPTKGRHSIAEYGQLGIEAISGCFAATEATSSRLSVKGVRSSGDFWLFRHRARPAPRLRRSVDGVGQAGGRETGWYAAFADPSRLLWSADQRKGACRHLRMNE